jgi:hypothetical protein
MHHAARFRARERTTLERHPTLSRIDRARGDHLPRFASAPNADALEAFARTLTEEYWGDYAWLTGNVPEAAFVRVCEQLEARCKRLALTVPQASARRDQSNPDANSGTNRQRRKHGVVVARTRVA